MKIDRLIGIITILLQCEKTTSPFLANRFEVSRRTILRDIDTLCLSGIPIVTTQGGDGGISIMDGYKLDKSLLTTDELQSIITGLRGVDSFSKTSNLENLLLKLSPNNNAVISLPDSVVIDLSSHYKDTLAEKISRIKQCIGNRKLIIFDYYSAKGRTKRKIEPYFIAFKWAAWYVFGWCTEKEDFRLFKLNRLWDLEVTGESYSQRDIPPEKSNLDRAHPDQFNIEILFDKSVRFRLIEDYGLHCYTETDTGLLFNLNYTNKEYIFSWLLSFGNMAELLFPPDLRNEFIEVVTKINKKYI